MMSAAFELSLTSPRLWGEVGDGAQRRLRVRGTLRESCFAERPLTPTLSPQERGEGAGMTVRNDGGN
jgi:hypothetical protein